MPLQERATALADTTAIAMQTIRGLTLAAVKWTEDTGFQGTPLEPTPARQKAAEELFFAVMRATSGFARRATGPLGRAGVETRPTSAAAAQPGAVAAGEALRIKIGQILGNLVAPMGPDDPIREQADQLRAKILADMKPPGGGGEVPS